MSNPTQQADNLYLRTREDLLQFEDSLFNSLIQGTANYYAPRNDNSIFGEIFRAAAIELAKIEYYYAYDQVNKNAQFLTPPDIRRRWADPLFISNVYPQATQSDLAYRTMLVELIQAYQQGSTVNALQDIIFAYTGLHVTVIELYTLIGQGFYDQSDRNAISVSIGVGGLNPFENVTNLNQLQAITQTLYGAIDLGKAAHVGLELSTVFGADENIDLFVTDRDTFVNDELQTIAVTGVLYGLNIYGNGSYSGPAYTATASGQPFGTDLGVTLEPPGPPAWNPLTQYIYRTSDPTYLSIVSYLGRYYYVSNPVINPPIGTLPTNTTLAGSPPRPYWTNVTTFSKVASAPGPYQYTINVENGVGIYFFNAYNLGQTVSLEYAWMSNPSGILDTLRIFVQLVEVEPFPPQLYLAPDLLPTTPRTGLAPVNGWPTNTDWGFGQVYGFTGSPAVGDSIVDPNGFVQQVTMAGISYPYWQAGHGYSIGDKIRDLSGNIQRVIAAGTSGHTVPDFNGVVGGTTVEGGSPPSAVVWIMEAIFAFNQDLAGTTQDGSVIWTNQGRIPGVLAPRIDKAWEISGGDTFNGFLMV